MTERTPAPAAEIVTDVWWEAFVDADVAGKIQIFTEKLDDAELVDEDSFEMLTEIRAKLDTKHQSQDRARYAELVQQLRDKKPDLFNHDAHYYQSNLISDAVVEGHWDVLAELLTPFVGNLEQGVDEFFSVMDVLMYHGQIGPLINTMFQARDAVGTSGELLPWVSDEFDSELIGLVLIDHAQTAPNPQYADSVLQEKLSLFTGLNEEWIESKFTRLTASTPRGWRVDDFNKTVNAGQWEDNLLHLLFDFMTDSRHRAGIPLSRSEMVHHILFSLLKEQTFGPSPHNRRQSIRRGKKRKRKTAQTGSISSLSSSLIPKRSAVDEALGSHFRFLSNTPYKAAAVTELLPGYLHFLTRMNLISPTEMEEGLEPLKPLVPQLVTLLEHHACDMRAIQTVKAAWSDKTLEILREENAT